MLIRQQLYTQLSSTLKSQTPSIPTLRNFLDQYTPSVPIPATQLHTLTLSQLHELHGQTVTFHMMVQDVLEPEYYAGAMVSKTFDPEAGIEQQILVNKYWPVEEQEYEEEKYEAVVMEREVYHLVPVKGEASWVRDWRGDKGEVHGVLVRVFGGRVMKLGEVVDAVAVVDFPKAGADTEVSSDPENPLFHYPYQKVPRLNMIRLLTKPQITQHRLDIQQQLCTKQVTFPIARHLLLKNLQTFCSQRYSQFLLYTLLSQQPSNIFISGQNLHSIISQLLPYALLLTPKLPLKQKLFPYKQHVMKETALQLSDRPTFITFDFTNFGAGTVKDQEITTLKQLKMLAEERELVYKWEYGESVFRVDCSGVIVRASSIIKPTFMLKDEKIDIEKVRELMFTYEELAMLRAYLVKCRALMNQMQITEEDGKKIQDDFVAERGSDTTATQVTADTFNLRVMIAKLECASRGMSNITYSSYVEAKEIVKKLN